MRGTFLRFFLFFRRETLVRWNLETPLLRHVCAICAAKKEKKGKKGWRMKVPTYATELSTLRGRKTMILMGDLSFKMWLLYQRDRADPVGAVARDVWRGVHKLPGGRQTLDRLLPHLQHAGAAPEAIEALRGAWLEWRRAYPLVCQGSGEKREKSEKRVVNTLPLETPKEK
jgi:hypothetical protein